jgi:hypothetical protein
MKKSALAAQLRVHFLGRGYSPNEMLVRSNDEIIGMIAGPCAWCGKTHIRGEKLDRLIDSSDDQWHFRSLWNDSNNWECLKA